MADFNFDDINPLVDHTKKETLKKEESIFPDVFGMGFATETKAEPAKKEPAAPAEPAWPTMNDGTAWPMPGADFGTPAPVAEKPAKPEPVVEAPRFGVAPETPKTEPVVESPKFGAFPEAPKTEPVVEAPVFNAAPQRLSNFVTPRPEATQPPVAPQPEPIVERPVFGTSDTYEPPVFGGGANGFEPPVFGGANTYEPPVAPPVFAQQQPTQSYAPSEPTPTPAPLKMDSTDDLFMTDFAPEEPDILDKYDQAKVATVDAQLSKLIEQGTINDIPKLKDAFNKLRLPYAAILSRKLMKTGNAALNSDGICDSANAILIGGQELSL